MTLVLFMLCSGFVHSTFGSSRLRFFSISEEGNWTQSFNHCKDKNGSLVTLYDAKDVEFINKFLNASNCSRDEPIWIGLHKHLYNVTTRPGGNPFISNIRRTNRQQICGAINEDKLTGLNCSEKENFMCYKDNYILIENEKDWCQAQMYCRRYFNDLVNISNEGQNKVIDKGKNKTFWIGLMHDEWEWVDNSCSTFRQWVGQEDDVNNCTTLTTGDSIQQNECDDSLISVCSNGTVRIIVSQEMLNWEQAFEYCKSKHTGLLQIRDRDDQQAVVQWLTHMANDTLLWIGLRQSRVFGFWIWRDWTVSYSQWRNNTTPEMPLSNHCGVISKTDFKWSDENCMHKHNFLCEEEISFMKRKSYEAS